ncbi:hypothetical protein Hte_005155 [Hypoxylon texense]
MPRLRPKDIEGHKRKKNPPFVDSIDVLDETAIGGAYHHDGPYDAAPFKHTFGIYHPLPLGQRRPDEWQETTKSVTCAVPRVYF